MFPEGGADGPLFVGGWDTAKLNGDPLPGICRARASILVKEDKKTKAGAHGGNPTLHGLSSQGVEIDVHVWTQPQLDEIDRILHDILPAPNLVQVPITFDHPDVRHLGITKIMVIGCGEWKESSVASGGRMVTIRATHWLPADKAADSATNTPKKAQRKNKRREDADSKKQKDARPANNDTVAPNQSTQPPLQTLP